jgi:16S rRNA (guanine966-N2)-methyltransferase
VLQNNIVIEGMKTLDIFAGTGSISYELASRGATDLTIIEKDQTMYEFIKKTAREFGLKNCRVIRSDAFKFLERCAEQFDFIFAGPPYALQNIDDIPRLVHDRHLLSKRGWFVLEHTPRNNYEGYPLYITKRNYGTTVFSIFVNTN